MTKNPVGDGQFDTNYGLCV